jgi:hypothetical protein
LAPLALLLLLTPLPLALLFLLVLSVLVTPPPLSQPNKTLPSLLAASEATNLLPNSHPSHPLHSERSPQAQLPGLACSDSRLPIMPARILLQTPCKPRLIASPRRLLETLRPPCPLRLL